MSKYETHFCPSYTLYMWLTVNLHGCFNVPVFCLKHHARSVVECPTASRQSSQKPWTLEHLEC